MAEIDVSYSPDGWKDSADAVRVKMKNDGYISANMISRRYRLVGKTILRKLTKMALKGELSCVRVWWGYAGVE